MFDLSLIILRIIQKRILKSGLITVNEDLYRSTGLSGKRVQAELNKWKVDKLTNDMYRFNDIDASDLSLILKAFHIDIPPKLYRHSELKSIKKNFVFSCRSKV